tara:strand:- start:1 stop:666 length:666 start_codon:yes stop_codon:yes gene_type:complete
MSKKWTQRDATAGATVSPGSINDELRAQQSSITTLDREQLPNAFVNQTRLKDYAIHRVYTARETPTGGEQTTAVYTLGAPSNAWNATPFRVYPGGWQSISSSAITLEGWKGGMLHFEWVGNAYVMGGMTMGRSALYPFSPRYVNLRITANGVTIAERRGTAYHEAFRVIASRLLPQGDQVIRLQWRLTGPSEDDALVNTGGFPVPQAHLWGMRFFAVGRWR